MTKARDSITKFFRNKVFSVLGYISLCFFPAFCLFIMDYMNFYAYNRLDSFLNFIIKHPLSFVFELLVVYIIFAFLFLICKKAVISTAVLGFISFLFAYINYTKFALNGDNFFPKDILMLNNAGELVSFISGEMPKYFFLGLIFAVVWIVLLGIIGINCPGKWRVRLPVGAVLLIAVIITFSSSARSSKILGVFNMSFGDTALQSSNYVANGFVGAFTVNVLSMNVETPPDYSEAKIDSIMSGYSDTPMAEDGENFDVIVVLSESFFDVRTLNGVEFSENPLSNYDEIITRDNCYSGKLYSTALGGGTVRTEFDVLAGLTTDYLPSGSGPYEFVTRPFDSYVSNYHDAGYRTVGLHLYDKTFYSRNTAYEPEGFDEFYGIEDISGTIDMTYKRGYATDASSFEAMEYLLGQSDEPTFLFTITIQNHQAFNGIDPAEANGIDVTSDLLSDDVLTAVYTYTQGLYDVDNMLKCLTDYVDSCERPTVLAFFGDHLPTLGSNYAAYNQTGVVDTTDGIDSEEAMFLYSTPFVIYSNEKLDMGSVFPENQGNEISAYNLLNAVAVGTGFNRTAYMNLLLDFYEVTPMYNPRLKMEETDEITEFKEAMRYIAYDRLVGKNYSAVNAEN